eukprot:TCONS_00011996-protein
MSEESVKVAVRVRPFNGRERDRNAKLIIEMNGQTTTITNPEDPDDVRKFSFDHSYWSHDGAEKLESGYFQPKNGSGYIGQEEVFNDLGMGILENAWQGYNTSLFAYGQTGSGKSWSVVGYGANKGVVPRLCEETFNRIAKMKADGENKTEYEVVFSMLEIYNEKVHDLLKTGKKSLRVRQHPKKGFYADGLTIQAVKDFADIERRMDEGTKNRTIAATNMNATSSRAHTIVGITLLQKTKNAAGEETTKSSIVNLVDLAGSERAESTGATGDRLKEGAAINQSLSSLGNCIAALAERSEGKKVRVPFRDSVLTKLLKNALGGNSKTIMIAALSPADINYEETLSTLRYADRAKQIKTKAVVNEDPTEKLIRDLQEENEKLKALLASGDRPEKMKSENEDDDDDDDEDEDEKGLSEEEIKARIEEELAARMAENERMVKEMEAKWEEKLAAAEQENKVKDDAEQAKKDEKLKHCHLYNLNPDPMLTGMIVHLLKEDINTIGRKDTNPVIELAGLNIRSSHGKIEKRDDGATYVLKGVEDARILVNGEPSTGEIQLQHNDRIMFGTSHLYVFSNPTQATKLKEEGKPPVEVTYEMAQKEIAKNSGVNVQTNSNSESTDGESLEERLLKEELSDFHPEVTEANAMSEELDKKVLFETIILSPELRGLQTGRKEIFVKVTQLETGYTWYWEKEKFLRRKYSMQEMFEDFQNGDDAWKVPAERDPFIESPEKECLVGVAQVYLQCVSYRMELIGRVPIVDYRGLNVGHVKVTVIPVKEDGTPLEADSFVEGPGELRGKRVDFVIHIEVLEGLPKRYTDVYCKYDVFTYENMKTKTFSSSQVIQVDFKKHITIDGYSSKIAKFFEEEPMSIKVLGKQKPDRKKPLNLAARLGQTTRDIMKAETLRKSQGGKVSKKTAVDWISLKEKAENVLMRKRMESLNKKLEKLKKHCQEVEKKGKTSVEIRKLMKHIEKQ